MASVLFCLARYFGRWDTPYDTALFCILLALDSNTLLRLAIWRSMRR